LHPDVVVMDIRMKRVDGATATVAVRAIDGPPVLVLTTFDDDETLAAALRAGAAGFVLKSAPGEDILRAISTVAAGDAWIDPHVAGRVLAAYRGHRRASRPTLGADRSGARRPPGRRARPEQPRGGRRAVRQRGHRQDPPRRRVLTKLDLRDRSAAIVFAHDNEVCVVGDEVAGLLDLAADDDRDVAAVRRHVDRHLERRGSVTVGGDRQPDPQVDGVAGGDLAVRDIHGEVAAAGDREGERSVALVGQGDGHVVDPRVELVEGLRAEDRSRDGCRRCRRRRRVHDRRRVLNVQAGHLARRRATGGAGIGRHGDHGWRDDRVRDRRQVRRHRHDDLAHDRRSGRSFVRRCSGLVARRTARARGEEGDHRGDQDDGRDTCGDAGSPVTGRRALVDRAGRCRMRAGRAGTDVGGAPDRRGVGTTGRRDRPEVDRFLPDVDAGVAAEVAVEVTVGVTVGAVEVRAEVHGGAPVGGCHPS
jgi:hypothetical protein